MRVSDLVPSNQPNMCMIAVFSGRCINTCDLENQSVTDSHANNLLKQVGKGISVLAEALNQENNKIKVDPVN